MYCKCYSFLTRGSEAEGPISDAGEQRGWDSVMNSAQASSLLPAWVFAFMPHEPPAFCCECRQISPWGLIKYISIYLSKTRFYTRHEICMHLKCIVPLRIGVCTYLLPVLTIPHDFPRTKLKYWNEIFILQQSYTQSGAHGTKKKPFLTIHSITMFHLKI